MPAFEGGVLRVYRLPIIVEAEDREEARRRRSRRFIEECRPTDDGGQDVFCDDIDLPASQWPVEEIEEELSGVIQWTSWAI